MALAESRSVVNVGAGAGSYEPSDRCVTAVEPSDVMVAQRAAHLAPAIRGTVAALPLRDRSVDAAMAILTVHHWDDQREAGVRELRRVARAMPDWTLGSFWAHPERVLDEAARSGTSAFARMAPVVVDRVVAAVGRDLRDGSWERCNGELRERSELDVGMRIRVARPQLVDRGDSDLETFLAHGLRWERFVSA